MTSSKTTLDTGRDRLDPNRRDGLRTPRTFTNLRGMASEARGDRPRPPGAFASGRNSRDSRDEIAESKVSEPKALGSTGVAPPSAGADTHLSAAWNPESSSVLNRRYAHCALVGAAALGCSALGGVGFGTVLVAGLLLSQVVSRWRAECPLDRPSTQKLASV